MKQYIGEIANYGFIFLKKNSKYERIQSDKRKIARMFFFFLFVKYNNYANQLHKIYLSIFLVIINFNLPTINSLFCNNNI